MQTPRVSNQSRLCPRIFATKERNFFQISSSTSEVAFLISRTVFYWKEVKMGQELWPFQLSLIAAFHAILVLSLEHLKNFNAKLWSALVALEPTQNFRIPTVNRKQNNSTAGSYIVPSRLLPPRMNQLAHLKPVEVRTANVLATQCGRNQGVLVKEAARIWKRMTQEQKCQYTMRAVRINRQGWKSQEPSDLIATSKLLNRLRNDHSAKGPFKLSMLTAQSYWIAQGNQNYVIKKLCKIH